MLIDAVKGLARACGVELRRFAPASSFVAQQKAMLAAHQIDLVFDVGANVGQFGVELRRQIGFKGRIVSFEPTLAAHERLCMAAQGDALWDVAPRAAIGAVEGSIAINIASNSLSSSVLPMLQAHQQAAPESRYSHSEVVPLMPLDSLAPRYLEGSARALLKIDTQGFEWQVLQGASETLKRVVGVQLELSLIPLYEGQKLMDELVDELSARGFDLWAISPVFADPKSGRLLQVDAAFFRSSATQ